jgi:predicted phosphodiesterase
MKIALISDIHGNSIALDAVLSDVRSAGGVDEYWIVGDHVAIGPDPNGVLERLTNLPEVSFTRGNTDRYVVTGDRPEPSLEAVENDPSLLPRLVQVCRSFAWTQGMVTAGGWLDWLSDLPLEKDATLPDGTRLLAVHASPGKDDGKGYNPGTDRDELDDLFSGTNYNVICVGHTHSAIETILGELTMQSGMRQQSTASGLASKLCHLSRR